MGGGDFQNPFLFLWQKKKRFLNAKEKEALWLYRGVKGKDTAARCFTQRTSTSPGHGHPWEEQGKAVVLSLSRLVCGPNGAWVRDAPEWKAARFYLAKMPCCWAKVSISAVAHLRALRRRRDNVSRRC